MRIPATLPALLSVAALAGCGGSSASHTSGGAAPAARTSTATGSAPASSSASTATATSTAPAGASATTSAGVTGNGEGGAGLAGPAGCRAATLALSYLGGQGATGHGELAFAMRNTGRQSCRTGGYPGIQFLDAAGGALPTTPTHATEDFFGHLPLAELTVRPGDSVSFRLAVTHGDGLSSSSCVTAHGLQVIAPNDTATMRVAIPGGASECGTATVSPVQPGDSAYR